MPMSLRLLVIGAGLAFAGATLAASQPATPATTKPHSAQQQRMIDCNKQATGKKGDERRAFMSSCLKGHHAATAPAKSKAKSGK